MTPEQKINLATALINLASAILMLYKANKQGGYPLRAKALPAYCGYYSKYNKTGALKQMDLIIRGISIIALIIAVIALYCVLKKQVIL